MKSPFPFRLHGSWLHRLSGSAIALALALLCTGSLAAEAPPKVVLETSLGNIVIELYPDEAPETVASFLGHVDSGFYEDTLFHRVIKRFMIQGGGYTRDLEYKDPGTTVINESDNGLRNERWTVAMARTDDPDSAGSQFFINLRMNPSLDAGMGRAGYTVFGRVVEGQYVVREISLVETGAVAGLEDVPLEPVLIHRARLEAP